MFTYCLGLLAHVTWPRLYTHEIGQLINNLYSTHTWKLTLFTASPKFGCLYWWQCKYWIYSQLCDSILTLKQLGDLYIHVVATVTWAKRKNIITGLTYSWALTSYTFTICITNVPPFLQYYYQSTRRLNTSLQKWVGTYSIMLLCGVLINTLCRHQWAM